MSHRIELGRLLGRTITVAGLVIGSAVQTRTCERRSSASPVPSTLTPPRIRSAGRHSGLALRLHFTTFLEATGLPSQSCGLSPRCHGRL